jgi:hypothetical protein
MADLTAGRSIDTKSVFPYTIHALVLASNTVYAGDLVAINGDGTAEPADDAASIIVAGVARNTAAAGEDVEIESGIIATIPWASAAAGDVGAPAYAAGGGAAKVTSTNYNLIGTVVGYVASTSVDVLVDFNANCAFANRETGEAD